MEQFIGIFETHPDLEALGLHKPNRIYWDLNTPQLYEHTIVREEGTIAHLGALVVRTGEHTGRSPKDRFIVKEPTTQDKIWWGDTNIPFEEDKFDKLHDK